MKFLYLLGAQLVSAGVIGVQQQVPILGHGEKEIGREVGPAIGVHFTTSYAVAAARYQNGTVRDLGKVVGDAEYIELMSRWTAWDHGAHITTQDW
jgi:hypothetical protein